MKKCVMHKFQRSMALVQGLVPTDPVLRHVPYDRLPRGTALMNTGPAKMRPCLKCAICGHSISTRAA